MYMNIQRAFGTRQNANKNTAVNPRFNLLEYKRIRMKTKMFITPAAVIVLADCCKIEQKKVVENFEFATHPRKLHDNTFAIFLFKCETNKY